VGYLDLKALAGYASCSVRWLRMQLHRKENPLPYFRIEGKVLVKLDEFDHWIAKYRVAPQPDELDQLIDDVVAQVSTQNIP
jgi:hypothetical protein